MKGYDGTPKRRRDGILYLGVAGCGLGMMILAILKGLSGLFLGNAVLGGLIFVTGAWQAIRLWRSR